MNQIIKVIQAPQKNRFGIYEKYDFFEVLMHTDGILGVHIMCMSPEKYQVQVLKEKFISEYKIPAELVDEIINLAETGAIDEYCKSISEDI